MEIDHVLVATRDLAKGARQLERRHGLRSVEGGRHPGWGTANRIVPLGSAYLELVAVVDPAEARDSAFGRWVADCTTGLAEPFGWAVRVHDLDAAAEGHGLAIVEGSRVTPTGETLGWRTAGLARAISEPPLPFFIEWAPGSSFPGARPREERDADGIARLVLSGARRTCSRSGWVTTCSPSTCVPGRRPSSASPSRREPATSSSAGAR